MVKSCEQLGSYLSHSLVVFRTGTLKTSYFTFFHFDKLDNLSLKKPKRPLLPNPNPSISCPTLKKVFSNYKCFQTHFGWED